MRSGLVTPEEVNLELVDAGRMNTGPMEGEKSLKPNNYGPLPPSAGYHARRASFEYLRGGDKRFKNKKLVHYLPQPFAHFRVN